MSDIAELESWFGGVERALVALSGGVDSALVAYAARRGARDAVALTADYQALPREDLDAARAACEAIGIRHIVIGYDELEIEEYARNGSDRCFHCRTELGARLRRAASELGASVIVDGTHAGDARDYRPGIAAMRAAGVRSPLAECGFEKADVRRCARDARLPNADRPANACLSSRIARGTRVTSERLARIEVAERIVREGAGVGLVRVRDAGDGSARIEVLPAEMGALGRAMRAGIASKLRMIGYSSVSVDPRGYRGAGAAEP